MKAIAYIRVSTNKQDTDAQVWSINRYAESNDIKIIDTIEEEFKSGRSKAIRSNPHNALQYYTHLAGEKLTRLERPGFKELLERIIDTRPDAVIIYKIDRLSRDCLELQLLMILLRKYKCDMIAVSQGGVIDTKGATGRFMYRIMAAQCEFECEQLSERTSTKMQQMKVDGRRLGGRPVGWDKDKENNVWVPNEEEQLKMAECFRLRKQGLSIRQISAEVGISKSMVPTYLKRIDYNPNVEGL